jgi:hypothetical protein
MKRNARQTYALSGQTEQASLAARHANVDRQLGAFERRAAVAPEGSEEKRRATEEFEAAKPAAAAEHAAIDADERKRVADSVTRYEIEAERAKLSQVRGSYNEELRLFEKMWDAKLATIQNGQEKAAAIEARDAERAALAARHQQELSDIRASTHEIELRTAGKDKEADVYRVTEEARKALDEAGDDLERKSAILAHERAQLEALRHEDKGAVFGSVSSYARDVQTRDLRNEGGASIQAAIDVANAEQASVDAARRNRRPTPNQPTPPPAVATNPTAPAPTVTAPATAPPTHAVPDPTFGAGRDWRDDKLAKEADARERMAANIAARPPLTDPAAQSRRDEYVAEQRAKAAELRSRMAPDWTPPPAADDEHHPTAPQHDGDLARQSGETIDAFRKRQMREKYHHDGAFRQNPLTAKWDERARRGDELRREREDRSQRAADLAGPGAASFTDAIMPGGGWFESLQPDTDQAAADAAALTDSIMPGGGWFESMQPGDVPNADEIANPTMDAIKAAMGGSRSPRQAAISNPSGMFAAGDDPQAKRDFKDGSSDFKEAADTFKKTVEDPRNQLYVVKF